MSLPLFQELTAPNGVKYTQPLGLFINNEFAKSKSGETLTAINPTNEQEITHVYSAGSGDVDLAVQAARAAFEGPEWSEIEPSKRGALLCKLADLVDKHREILATIETWNNGKPFSVSRDEDVVEVATVLRYYGGWSDKIHGKTIDIGPTNLVYTRHEPFGVCGQIIPWNYPLGMAAWKLGPALATGNTVVLKPSEQTPLSILYLAQLIKEAGFPPGVVNILNGYGKTTGAAIAAHPGIAKIAFTGSTATGKLVMKAASDTMKSITLETGGKSPLIIFEDADLDQAVKWGHIGIMSNAGQICCATSRIYVHESRFDEFLKSFKEQVKNVSKVGDPFSDDTFQGPQVSKMQFDRVMAYIEAGKREGATLALGGTRSGDEGYFVTPTIFTNVKDHMTISREEVFGPFVTISSFKSEEEVIKRANDTTYGLGAALFTQNVARAHKVARKLSSGVVWINSSNIVHPAVPFGGFKQSGIGRELGEYALTAYTNVKAVYVNLGANL